MTMIESTTKQGENEDLETCKIVLLNFLTFGFGFGVWRHFYHKRLNVTL